MSQDPVNRWLILAGAVISNMCIGSAYAWSVYQKPLIALFRWSTPEVSLAFTLCLGIMPVAMIVAGKMQDHYGAKRVVITGSLLFSSGIMGAGFTDSLTTLYMTYGVLGGIGTGTIAAIFMANAVKFFPDKRGLASGSVAAGFATGAIIVAPVASALIQSSGVLATFKVFGMAYLVILMGCSLLIRTAPPDYRPDGWTPATAAAANVTRPDKDWRGMLADPLFYVLWGMFLVNSISGLMIIGHASPISQEMIHMDAQQAAFAVGLLALGNAAGRIVWGLVSDKIGRYNAIMIIFSCFGSLMIAMTHITQQLTFMAVLVMIGLCYGGVMGIFPSITADMFGPKNLGMNYGIINTAFGTAAFIGPRLAAHYKEINQGDYSQAFLVAAALSTVGIILTVIARRRSFKGVDSLIP